MSVKTLCNRLLNMNLWDADPTAPTPVEPAQPHGSLQAASFSCGKLSTQLFPQHPSSRPEPLVSKKDTWEHSTGSELWCVTRSSPETQVLAAPRLTSTDQLSQGPPVLTTSLTVLKLHYTFLINPFHWVKSFNKEAQPAPLQSALENQRQRQSLPIIRNHTPALFALEMSSSYPETVTNAWFSFFKVCSYFSIHGKRTFKIHLRRPKIITVSKALPSQNCCGQQRQETLITIIAQLAAVKSGHQAVCC